MTTPWPPEAEQQLRDLWPKHPATEIAGIMGISRSSVIGKGKRMGLRLDQRPRAKATARYWTPERKAKLAEMRASGMEWKDIGKHFGNRPYSTVANIGHQMGLEAPAKPIRRTFGVGKAQTITNIGGRPGRKKRGQEFNTIDPAVTKSICLAYAPGYDKEAMRDRRNAGKCLLCDEPRLHPYDFCAGPGCAKLKQEKAA